MPHRHRRPSAAGVVLSACLAAAVLAGCTVEEKSGSTARVEQVIAGDTVRLSGVGITRLLGANAPEDGRCGADAATRFTQRRLEGKRVKYELGEDSKDRWRRTLAYLRRGGGGMHNLALVEGGYATADTIAPNTKYAEQFEAAEEEAKQQEKGPLADCAEKRKEAALRRARAKERAERAERAEQLAEKLRAAEKRAKEQRQDPGGDGSGGDGSGGDGSGGDGSRGDGSRGDEAAKKLRRVLRWKVRRSDPEPTRRSSRSKGSQDPLERLLGG
jgi:endonuclease YncB( thermonuclease family)